MASAAPAAPLRKKRNYKGLGLDVSAGATSNTSPTQLQPAPTRLAPAPGGGKKRPPPMTLAPKPAIAPSAADPDSNLLTVSGPSSAPATGTASAHRMTYHTTLSTTLANLDMNAENKYQDLKNEDLKDMQELGQGNGGSVKKVEHVPTGTIMAKKVCSHFPSTLSASKWRCSLYLSRLSHRSLNFLDCLDRCQTICTKADPSRVADHA